MFSTKKRLIAIVTSFAIIMTLGVAYAASVGFLRFDVTAELNLDLHLEIVNESYLVTELDAARPTTTTVDIDVAADGRSAEIHIDFMLPGDIVTISFDVENTGVIDAELQSITFIDDSANPNTGAVTIAMPIVGLDASDLPVNVPAALGAASTVGTYDIVITWNAGVAITDDTETIFTFRIDLNYDAA